MSRRVVVLDYGSGNLRSAERALARVGADVTVTADRRAALDADGLVVPGVGAFAACMGGLVAVGGDAVMRERVAGDRPVLGICVGMQVLFERGDEHGLHTPGVGLLAGTVRRLSAPVLPHMGWNTVRADRRSRLLAGIGGGERVYFVHSYAVPVADGAVAAVAGPAGRGTAAPPVVSTAEHGEPFVAVVERGVLGATQFHPEKSGDVGAHLLENWLDTL